MAVCHHLRHVPKCTNKSLTRTGEWAGAQCCVHQYTTAVHRWISPQCAAVTLVPPVVYTGWAEQSHLEFKRRPVLCDGVDVRWAHRHRCEHPRLRGTEGAWFGRGTCTPVVLVAAVVVVIVADRLKITGVHCVRGEGVGGWVSGWRWLSCERSAPHTDAHQSKW